MIAVCKKHFIVLSECLVAVLCISIIYVAFSKKKEEVRIIKSGFILISNDANFNQVMDSLAPFINYMDKFEKLAKAKKLEEKIKAGRYRITEDISPKDLINLLVFGMQKEDTFMIMNYDNVYQMIGRVSKKIEADSLKFVKVFDSIAVQKGFQNAEDLKYYFISDTYNFYWTTTPEEFFRKFEKLHDEFWTNENISKKNRLGITKDQVYSLAAIVHKESGGKPDEQSRIAGLYLNRYHRGMPLQSDPTVIYAMNKEADFTKSIKRLYHKNLKIDSPYNTYIRKGIPPKPICMVSKSTLENVLNAEKNDYIYMVADPKRPGYHNFTKSYREHRKHARQYHMWLNTRKIR